MPNHNAPKILAGLSPAPSANVLGVVALDIKAHAALSILPSLLAGMKLPISSDDMDLAVQEAMSFADTFIKELRRS